MASLNIRFLEEFKHFDKLCREIYRSEKGITSYIEDMERVPAFESRCIPNWDDDLKNRVRLRHLRNQLAHEAGSMYADICTQDDAEWLKLFYGRVLGQSDPLALLTHRKAEKARQTLPCPQFSAPVSETAKSSKRPAGCPSVVIALLCAFFLLLAVSIIIWQSPGVLPHWSF